MCLTICPTFDSIHSQMMKSFIIKKPNQTTPQFGNLWLDFPGRDDQREWSQTHTPLIYCCFHPGPNYSLHVKSKGSESLHNGRASQHVSIEKGLNYAVTLLWYHLAISAGPQDFLVIQCTLLWCTNRSGTWPPHCQHPPTTHESKRAQMHTAGWKQGTVCFVLYFHTWQLSVGKNSLSDANLSLTSASMGRSQ